MLNNNLAMSLFIILIATSISNGAVTIESGKDKEFWRNHAVVLAKITNVSSEVDSDQFDATVIAVISTDFLVPTAEPMRVHYTPGPESATSAAKNNTTVLLCIEKREDKWKLPTNRIAFMPSGNAICVVKDGRDDMIVKVEQTVRKLKNGGD